MRLVATDFFGLLRPSECDLRVWLRAQGEKEAPPGTFAQLLMSLGEEHERRHLAAKLLRRAQLRAIQRRPLPGSELERHLQLERGACTVSTQRDARCVTAEAHQLSVDPRPRRKPLRADVQ